MLRSWPWAQPVLQFISNPEVFSEVKVRALYRQLEFCPNNTLPITKTLYYILIH